MGKDGRMGYELFGAVLIVGGCGGFGVCLGASARREVRELEGLLRALDLMENQLQYRLTPLPELCRMAGKEACGTVGRVFDRLARELDQQTAPEVAGCMKAALREERSLSPDLGKALTALGRDLGRFDLPGQLRGLERARARCGKHLEEVENCRVARLREYRTLGLCAGAALAILLL